MRTPREWSTCLRSRQGGANAAPFCFQTFDGPKPGVGGGQVWGNQWQVNNYNEILIGPKRDPFCFQVFPELWRT